MQRAPAGLGHGDKVGFVAQQVVQTAGEVEPLLQRLHQHLLPRLRDLAAPVGDADHQGLRTGGLRLGEVQVVKPDAGLAALHPELADRVVGAPVADALCHLGGQLVGRIAQEQQIGGLDHGGTSQDMTTRAPVVGRAFWR